MCLRELCLFRVRAYSLASLAVARLMFTVTEPNYEEKSRAQAKRPHHTHTHTHTHTRSLVARTNPGLPNCNQTSCQSRQSERNKRIKTKSWWTLSIHVKTLAQNLQLLLPPTTLCVTANCHNHPCPFSSSSALLPNNNNNNNSKN
jgi:hypothetical protein